MALQIAGSPQQLFPHSQGYGKTLLNNRPVALSRFANIAAKVARVAISRLLGTGLQFLAQVAVGRVLGPGAVGILGATQSHILLIGSAASLGAPEFVQRRTAAVKGPHREAITNRWLQFGLSASLAGGVIGGVLFSIYWLALPADEPDGVHRILGAIIALGIGLYAIARVHLEFLKGRGSAAKALTLEFTLPYLAVLIAALACLVLPKFQSVELLPAIAFAIYFAVVAALLVRGIGLHRLGLKIFHKAIMQARSNMGELASLMLTQVGSQAVGALPTILVFGVAGPTVAGLLVVILKLLGLVGTISGILSAYFISPVSSAIRSKNIKQIRWLYFMTMASNGGVSGIICLAMLFVPEIILSAFGAEFASPEAVLALKCGAMITLVRQFTGISAIFLNLSGRASLDAVSHLVAMAVLISGLVFTVYLGEINNLAFVTILVAVSGLVRPAISACFVMTTKGLWR